MVRMEHTMETPIKSSTHRIIKAIYSREVLFAVPKEWELDDISVKWNDLFYKGDNEECPSFEFEEDYKYPNEVVEEVELDIEDYFDCESESECDTEREYCPYCSKKLTEKTFMYNKDCVCLKCHTEMKKMFEE